MKRRFSVPLRTAAVAAATCVVGAVASPAAFAADGEGDVQVVNTETVQVYTDAAGAIETQRIYEQLALTGQGTVEVRNPIQTEGLRNLDGFGGFDVDGGEQVATMTVDGEERLRTVSDYDGKLPLNVKVEYFLDGEQVDPGDVVGEDGKLEVRYTVKNVTAVAQEVSFDDGKGGTVTKTVEVPIPMVGSLTTVAPSNFTNVDSDQANMAGDGKGGTKLSFTMTLFPPIGSDTAEFGYTADITDGVIPRASISALPVNPLESPSFKTAGESYKGGADTGAKLADGATQIDENLLKLRDGAGELLAGLIQLRDGAQQLNAGLAGEAAPGADRLAVGAGELANGIGQIDEGAGKLAAGAGRLDEGANTLADGLTSAQQKAPALLDGLTQLRAGLVKVDRGLRKLSNSIGGLPTKAKPLHDGIDLLLAGIGDAETPDTLIYGVSEVRKGLTGALPDILKMASGVYNVPSASNPDPGAYQKLGCALDVINLLNSGAGDPENPCFAEIKPLILSGLLGAETNPYRKAVLKSLSDSLGEGRQSLATPEGAVNQTTLYGGLMTLYGKLSNVPSAQNPTPGAIVALAAVQCGLDNTSLAGQTLGGVPLEVACKRDANGDKKPGLVQGLGALDAGITQLVDGVVDAVQAGVGKASDTPKDETLRGGMSGLIDGVDKLSAGGGDLLEGLGLLAGGSGQLADGTGELSAGAGQLADGTGKAADGAGQLSDGANKLATGLGDAANGSGQLADGLGKAAKGAPKLKDGAQRLSDEGTSQLVEAGKSTAQSYGEMYAVIEAGAERAQSEKMVYGAPEGAIGLAAYSYEIKGENGEDGRNMARGLGGVAVLAAGAGALALRRRFI